MKICVFCGSRDGALADYVAQAEALGKALVGAGHGLVYGGAQVGLMGAVANAVLHSGGEATGVIPSALSKKEIAHDGLTELHVVDSMHERKALMNELSDAFIAMPGGGGTLEELFEVFTWAQLGIHHKPIGLLNVAGFYDKLLAFVDHAVSQQFLIEAHRQLILVSKSPYELLDQVEAYVPVPMRPWVRPDQS
jgi:uncharacterized protein (TIGR00730 family)